MAERSGTETRQRDYILPVRLNEFEKAELAERVARTGYSRAALVRYGLFQTPLPRAIPRPRRDDAAIALLLEHFGKTCSNINQYTRRRNMGRDSDTLDAAMEAALLMLLELRGPCLRALGEDA